MIYKRTWLVFILIFTIISCKQPKELVYQGVNNFRLEKAGLAQTKIGLDIRFYNPNRYPLKLKHAAVDVFLNGNYLGKMILEDHYTIPKLDTFLLPVTLNANLKDLIVNAVQWIANKKVDVKLQGTVKAGRGGLFYTIPIQYEGKQELNIE